MAENLSICPVCGEPFEPVGREQDLPLESLEMKCCEGITNVGILYWPNDSFTVVGPALDHDTCDDCGESADVRLQETGSVLEGRCMEHLGASRVTLVDFAKILD